jgi:hypothetical protein
MHNKHKEKLMEFHADDDLGVHNKYLAIAIHVAIRLVVVRLLISIFLKQHILWQCLTNGLDN